MRGWEGERGRQTAQDQRWQSGACSGWLPGLLGSSGTHRALWMQPGWWETAAPIQKTRQEILGSSGWHCRMQATGCCLPLTGLPPSPPIPVCSFLEIMKLFKAQQ